MQLFTFTLHLLGPGVWGGGSGGEGGKGVVAECWGPEASRIHDSGAGREAGDARSKGKVAWQKVRSVRPVRADRE